MTIIPINSFHNITISLYYFFVYGNLKLTDQPIDFVAEELHKEIRIFWKSCERTFNNLLVI